MYVVARETTKDMEPHSSVVYWVVREGERTPPEYDAPYGPFIERFQGSEINPEARRKAERRAEFLSCLRTTKAR